jgi:hypothetical protein
MTRGRAIALLLAALLLPAGVSRAADLPLGLRETSPRLVPVGAATLHWFGLHIYDVALFAPDASYTAAGTAALSIRYNISIKRRRLLETTLKEWRRLDVGQEARRMEWIRELEPLWPDLKHGDRLTAYRREGGPTQFYYGDRLLGEVADPAFGPAFFAIWLDERCHYPDVRNGLLGRRPQ